MMKSICLKGSAAVSRITKVALLFMTMAAATLQVGAPTAQAAQANLSWSAPTTYSDGKAVTGLKGYKLYQGTAPGAYTQSVDVGNVTSYTVGSLVDATTYYFAVTASDSSGLVSGYSNQVAYATPAAPVSTLYTLTAAAGSGGSISPSGAVVVSKGASQSFAITPATGYKIADVAVDGASVGALSSYNFSNVAASHTISASYAASTVTAPAPITSSTVWQNKSIASKTGTFTVGFDMTANANNSDALTVLSAGPATAFTSGATVVRFNTAGNIDARNGGAYAAKVALPYSAGKTYHVRMSVNVTNHVYDVYVTPPGGAEVQLAAGYAFRTEQAKVTALNNLGVFSDAGSHTVSNLTVQ